MPEAWDMPFPLPSQSEGRSVTGAQLNVQKLMSFLGMPITTTMLTKLKGDPELAESLRLFLNDELAVNLDSLHDVPLDHPQHHGPTQDSPNVNITKAPPHAADESKSLFRLRINKLGGYFEGDDSNAVLPIVCKGNSILAVLDGGAGVSIVTKRC